MTILIFQAILAKIRQENRRGPKVPKTMKLLPLNKVQKCICKGHTKKDMNIKNFSQSFGSEKCSPFGGLLDLTYFDLACQNTSRLHANSSFS